MSIEVLRRAFDGGSQHSSRAVSLAVRAMEEGSDPLPLMASGSVGGALARSNFLTSNIQSRNQYNRYTGWIYACCRIRAERIAGQPIRVGVRVSKLENKRRKRPGMATQKYLFPKSWQADDIEIIDEHPLLDVMKNPNPYMTSHTLLAVTVISLDLTGRSYWWLTEDDGVRNIWYLPASWVTPKHTQTQLFAEYEVRPGDSTETFIVPGDEIMHIYEPDPSDPLKAFSKLQAAARPVQTDEQIQECQRKTFMNGINPLVMVVMGRIPNTAELPGTVGVRPTVSPEMKARIQSGILQQFQSAANFGKPIIADQDIEKIEFLNRPPAEMGFIDSSKLTKERILQVWGVSEISIGQMQNANRAGAATADALLVSGSVNPTAALISEAMSAWLGPWFASPGQELCIWIEPATPIDAELDHKRNESMVKYGVILVDEYRGRNGMPPLPNGQGQVLMRPNTHTAVPAGEGVAGGGGPEVDDGEVEDDMAAARSSCWFKQLGVKGFTDVWTRTHDRFAKRLEKDLSDMFAEMAGKIAKEYEQSGGGAHPHDLVNIHHWRDRLVAISKPHLESAAVAGATIAWEMYKPRLWFDRGFTPGRRKDLPPNVLEAIAQFIQQLLTASFWSDVGMTVKNTIASILTAGVTAGQSIKEIAANIKEAIGVGNSQALNIANTEVTGSLNAGQQATYIELEAQGVIIGRRWFCITDGRTRDSHLAANGQARPVKEPFLVGGEEGMFPGDMAFSPKERCQCRCTLLSILPGESMDDKAPTVPA